MEQIADTLTAREPLLAAQGPRFVVVSCPIRNRAWAVEQLLEAMQRQTFTPDWLSFVTGDNEDGTEAALEDACLRGGDYGFFIDAHRHDTGCPGWHRSGEPRYSINDHASLAEVYNLCIDQSLLTWPEMTHLWMLDSDVIPDPNVLELLLAADKGVVAAVVRNSPGAWNFMLGERDGEPCRTGAEPGRLQLPDPRLAKFRDELFPFPATFVSACVLYRREALEPRDGPPIPPREGLMEGWEAQMLPGPRFAPDPRSHDFPMQAALRAAGITCWVEPRARTSHYYGGPGKEPLR